MSDCPPAWIQGAWRRQGRSLDDGPLIETSRVLWLQVGAYFADFRSPNRHPAAELSALDRAQAFSGVSSYRAPTMAWRHDLDTLGRTCGYYDEADLQPEGDRLIERGPHYLERWQSVAPAETSAVVEARDSGTGEVVARMVVVADHAVLVVGGAHPAGASLHIDHDRWRIEDEIGTAAIPWAAISVARTGGAACGWERVA